MIPRKTSQLDSESRTVKDSERDYSISNLCPSTLNPFKVEVNNAVNSPKMNDKTKQRRSHPSPTPVQSNPIFKPQYGKSLMSAPIRQRRGSFLYKQESSSNIGDVISPKYPSTKNLSLSTNDEFIITPFAQILAKLRSTFNLKCVCINEHFYKYHLG